MVCLRAIRTGLIELTKLAPDGLSVMDTKKSGLTHCEEENQRPRENFTDSRGDLLDEPSREPSVNIKRLSLFQRLFGRKIPKSSQQPFP